MSDLGAALYGWPSVVTPTASATATDPAGPFAALYVTVSGTLLVAPYNGPGVKTFVNLGTVPVGLLPFPVRAVSSSSTATVIGLVQNGQAVKAGT